MQHSLFVCKLFSDCWSLGMCSNWNFKSCMHQKKNNKNARDGRRVLSTSLFLMLYQTLDRQQHSIVLFSHDALHSHYFFHLRFGGVPSETVYKYLCMITMRDTPLVFISGNTAEVRRRRHFARMYWRTSAFNSIFKNMSPSFSILMCKLLFGVQ